jgi:hypothetical protein
VGCRKAEPGKDRAVEFEVDRIYERGPLTAHVRVSDANIDIAGTVMVELEAAIGPGYEVTMPKVDKVLEHFGIVDWENCGDRLAEDNKVVRRYRYRLEPFLSGSYAIPAFTFEFHDINRPVEKKYELTSEPIEIEVASLLGEDRDKLEIADIEDVVDMPAETSFLWLWALGGGAVAAAAGFLFLRRRRKAGLVRIYKPAHEIAYERLRVLVKDDLIKAGRIKEFYERISDILRHYIEHRFELRAPERTTEEFLIELASMDVLAEPDKRRLADFLSHCDLVKFARYNPTTKQIQRTFNLVKDFVETTKSDERKIDVTEPTQAVRSVEVGSV